MSTHSALNVGDLCKFPSYDGLAIFVGWATLDEMQALFPWWNELLDVGTIRWRVFYSLSREKCWWLHSSTDNPPCISPCALTNHEMALYHPMWKLKDEHVMSRIASAGSD